MTDLMTDPMTDPLTDPLTDLICPICLDSEPVDDFHQNDCCKNFIHVDCLKLCRNKCPLCRSTIEQFTVIDHVNNHPNDHVIDHVNHHNIDSSFITERNNQLLFDNALRVILLYFIIVLPLFSYQALNKNDVKQTLAKSGYLLGISISFPFVPPLILFALIQNYNGFTFFDYIFASMHNIVFGFLLMAWNDNLIKSKYIILYIIGFSIIMSILFYNF